MHSEQQIEAKVRKLRRERRRYRIIMLVALAAVCVGSVVVVASLRYQSDVYANGFVLGVIVTALSFVLFVSIVIFLQVERRLAKWQARQEKGSALRQAPFAG